MKREAEGGWVGGHAAYVYLGRRMAMHSLTRDEARRIARQHRQAAGAAEVLTRIIIEPRRKGGSQTAAKGTLKSPDKQMKPTNPHYAAL